MEQNELDEISDAFLDAWKESFGQEMYYVPFLKDDTPVHPIYNESKKKKYDLENKVLFTGTFKELTNEEAGELFGNDTKVTAEITFVTKELYEQGVTKAQHSALVEITHRDGTTNLYDITEVIGKVQLGNNRILTKLGVVERG